MRRTALLSVFLAVFATSSIANAQLSRLFRHHDPNLPVPGELPGRHPDIHLNENVGVHFQLPLGCGGHHLFVCPKMTIDARAHSGSFSAERVLLLTPAEGGGFHLTTVSASATIGDKRFHITNVAEHLVDKDLGWFVDTLLTPAKKPAGPQIRIPAASHSTPELSCGTSSISPCPVGLLEPAPPSELPR